MKLPSFRSLTASAALAFLPVLASQAALRTFTSPNGQTIQAEIVSASAADVTLKMANGAVITATLDKFSRADQAFVAEWLKSNAAAIKYSFDLNFSKDKTDSSKRMLGNTEVTTERWLCHIKFTNRSNVTLDNVSLKYDIYYTAISGNQSIVKKFSGDTKVAPTKHLETVSVSTKEIVLEKSKLEGGFYYADGSRSRQRDSIDGIAIDVFHNGQKVHSWVSSGVPKDRVAPTQ